MLVEGREQRRQADGVRPHLPQPPVPRPQGHRKETRVAGTARSRSPGCQSWSSTQGPARDTRLQQTEARPALPYGPRQAYGLGLCSWSPGPSALPGGCRAASTRACASPGLGPAGRAARRLPGVGCWGPSCQQLSPCVPRGAPAADAEVELAVAHPDPGLYSASVRLLVLPGLRMLCGLRCHTARMEVTLTDHKGNQARGPAPSFIGFENLLWCGHWGQRPTALRAFLRAVPLSGPPRP